MTAHGLFSQCFLDFAEGDLPCLVLIDGKVFKRFACCLRCALFLQVGLQDIDIAVGLLQALKLLIAGLGETLFAVENRLGRRERVGGLDGRLALVKGESVGAYTEAFEQGTGDVQIDLVTVMLTRVISWTRSECGG